MKIVLASESEFRRRALDMLGLTYEICPSKIDEKAIRDPDPSALTQKLAEEKAGRVAENYCHQEVVIVSGDAVAAKDGVIFEKPRDHAEAAEFLRCLSASTFQFVTSVCVLNSRTHDKLSVVGVSDITFRELRDVEIDHYIRTHDVLRYAGAFESDAVLRFSERICGSYNFVTAIPMSQLVTLLRAQGIAI